jgi:hypothetical protein
MGFNARRRKTNAAKPPRRRRRTGAGRTLRYSKMQSA